MAAVGVPPSKTGHGSAEFLIQTELCTGVCIYVCVSMYVFACACMHVGTFVHYSRMVFSLQEFAIASTCCK